MESTASPAGPAHLSGELSRLYRVGAWSAGGVGAGYVIIVALYARVGAPPSDGPAWLSYGAGRTSTWWWIVALSVLTDLLYLPVAVALYRALADVDREVAGAGAGLLAGFVTLDLAVTWPNYAALISLSRTASGADDPGRRSAQAGAADLATAVLSSRFEAFLAIGLPAAGILLLGILIRRGPLTPVVGWIGVVTGALGLIAVVGPAISHLFDPLVILTSVATTVWFMVLARDLRRLARRDHRPSNRATTPPSGPAASR
jgi:hypothetical protein